MTILGAAGHMHLLGRWIKIADQHRAPPRSARCSTSREWDFDNQGAKPVEPVHLEAGDTVTVTCHHEQDLRDLLPAFEGQQEKYVVWAEGTTDEMCLGMLQVVYDDDEAGSASASHQPQHVEHHRQPEHHEQRPRGDPVQRLGRVELAGEVEQRAVRDVVGQAHPAGVVGQVPPGNHAGSGRRRRRLLLLVLRAGRRGRMWQRYGARGNSVGAHAALP